MKDEALRDGIGRRAAGKAFAATGLLYLVLAATISLGATNLSAFGNPDLSTAFVLAVLPSFAIGSIGGVLAWRRHSNAMGWLFLAAAIFSGVQGLTQQYEAHTLVVAPGSLPAAGWVAAIGGAPGSLIYPGMVVLILLLFPDGRLPSRRWRWLIWLVSFQAAVNILVGFLDPTPIRGPGVPPVANPTGLGMFKGLETGPVGELFWLGGSPLALAAVASLIVRLRRTRGVERQQVRWVVYSLGITIVLNLVLLFSSFAVPELAAGWISNVLVVIGFGIAFPASVAIAILRFRLYDIDVVISRTLVYGALAAFITAVYVGIVVGVGTLVGSGGQPNLVLSIVATAIVAVAFQPVRERLQKIANRLVYGQRATPYEVLSQFSERVAETYSADEALPRMARVLGEGTGAERAEVWLRAGETLRPAAAWPTENLGHSPLRATGGVLPEIPHADRAVPVRHQGELLGALTVSKRPGESLTPVEEKLVDDLAAQAGLVLKNVGLTAELLQRLEELRASRQRLVAAQDEERRRLERNLHDGAQQNLVALKVKLGLAEAMAEKDPARAKELVVQLKADADEALETLRDLARGIYPPLLADRGLVAALESQARKATVPVEVMASDIRRYPQDVEAAVYFCCLEALQNVQKYAHATQAEVSLLDSGGELRFEISDDGQGFDPTTAKRGSGLTNMSDRLDALGGTVEVRSRPSEGTILLGTLPIQALVPTA
jgi:signal transduction histidine kinase